VTESDTFFKEGSGAVPIETVAGGTETTLQTVPVWRFYVGNADSPTWSVYWNGSGELTHPDSLSMSGGKKYVQVDTNNKPIYYDYQFSASYYFTEQVTGACGKALSSNANAIAVANNKFGSFGHNCGDQYYIDIPGLGNTIFTVMDRGTFVVEGDQPDHFDIYVGIQDHESFENSPLAQYDGQLVRVAKVQP